MQQSGFRPAAYGAGIAHLGSGGRALETWYPVANLQEHFRVAGALADATGHTAGSGSYRLSESQIRRVLDQFASELADGQPHPNLEALRSLAGVAGSPPAEGRPERAVVVTFIGDIQEKPVDVHDAYLRLHLLSMRKVKPRGLSLDGMIPLLPIVVWTSEGPFDPESWPAARLRLKLRGIEPSVYAVDKFPRMVDYVIPSGVRIADASRVRLGAHLGEGTTVMHEGFCNFNAGTLGTAMVEGRISQGVVVGNGTDIGGGASIMGTLSGGGTEIISIGENCLIGANAGTGISLGDNCTIEAGTYVTATAKVKLLPDGPVVKALDLSGRPGMRYWRNSVTGQLEAQIKPNTVALNTQLHQAAPVPAGTAP